MGLGEMEGHRQYISACDCLKKTRSPDIYYL